MKTLKYFSMFSGIGGFEYGMQQSKHKFKNVGYSEIDKYARSIYEKHYPNHICFGDATEINTEDLPDFSILIGGFPCQTFSVAGKRAGFNDTRGTMFFELARILRDRKPRYFLFENVKGLLSHDGGRTLQTILKTLNELRYNVQWEIYNSCNYNVPQNRERIFIKGYLGKECGREVLSVRRDSKKTNVRLKNRLKKVNNQNTQGYEVYSTNGVSKTLCSNSGGLGGKTGLYIENTENSTLDKIQTNFTKINDELSITTTKEGNCYLLLTGHKSHPLKDKQDNYVLENQRHIQRVGNISNTNHHGGEIYNIEGLSPALLSRDYKDPKKILETNESNPINETTNNFRIRRLTPIECERLQGFPDNWTKYGKNEELISDTQRYKCLGNAVTTTVITAIVNQMFDEKGEIK